MANVTIDRSGPYFDGRARKAITDLEREWVESVAETGNVMVRANLNAVLRHQTPYYRTRIAAVRDDPSRWRVSDQGVIYGPWLEGVGSRNRTTRFKGYFTFRRTCQQLDRKAKLIGEFILRRFIGRMN